MYLPSSHLLHFNDPIWLVKVPGSQLIHELDDSAEENVPTEQYTQDPARPPIRVEYVPTEQP